MSKKDIKSTEHKLINLHKNNLLSIANFHFTLRILLVEKAFFLEETSVRWLSECKFYCVFYKSEFLSRFTRHFQFIWPSQSLSA